MPSGHGIPLGKIGFSARFIWILIQGYDGHIELKSTPCCLSDLFSSSRSIFGSMLPAPVSAPAPDPNSPPAQVEGAGARWPGRG